MFDKCLLNGCNGFLLLLFSESQESAELFHLVLYFWGEMNSCLELRSEQIRSRSKKKPKATHTRLQYEQDKFIFKDIY